MKKRTSASKLALHRETLRHLTPDLLRGLAGGASQAPNDCGVEEPSATLGVSVNSNCVSCFTVAPSPNPGTGPGSV